MLEAALLSLTPSYIAQLKDSRPKLHDKLNKLKSNIDRPLAAILTLNTIAHTVGATGVGAQVSIVFGDAHVAIASALMTVTTARAAGVGTVTACTPPGPDDPHPAILHAMHVAGVDRVLAMGGVQGIAAMALVT